MGIQHLFPTSMCCLMNLTGGFGSAVVELTHHSVVNIFASSYVSLTSFCRLGIRLQVCTRDVFGRDRTFP